MSCSFEQCLINCSLGLELKIDSFFPIPLDLGKEPLEGHGKPVLSDFSRNKISTVWSPEKEVIFCHVLLPQSRRAGPL